MDCAAQADNIAVVLRANLREPEPGQLTNALPGASGSLALEGMQKKIAAAAIDGTLSPPEKQNGNPASETSDRRLRAQRRVEHKKRSPRSA